MLIILLAAGAYFLYVYQNTASRRMPDRYDGEIETFVSSHDQDEDGIDDQTDILEGVIAYIKTEPKYESRYYETGYPDDEYGVCTDVVAAGLKNAGYDLMELVDEDIRKHPEEYDIEKPDKRIDFRRVRNLLVYFSHTAVKLTTDIHKIEEWQGGDIVIFKKHIGIVSDRRNAKGIPYVIHHAHPMQERYEQDILGFRDDLVAHFRVSE